MIFSSRNDALERLRELDEMAASPVIHDKSTSSDDEILIPSSLIE